MYFIKTESGQEGPFTPDELNARGISAATPVLQEGTDNWTTAGELEELKALLGISVSTEAPAPSAGITPSAETVAATAPEPSAPAATVAVAAAGKKTGSAVIGWILSFAVMAGAGYYVYQDIEKNNKPADSISTGLQTDSTSTEELTTSEATDSTTTTEIPVTDTTSFVSTEPVPESNTNLTTTANSADPAAVKKAEEEKKKLLAAQAKKKEDEKKRQLAEAKKKEAAAAAARETALRNNWARYVTVGSFKIEGDDKVKPFTIPVNNGYSVPLDKVTLRVDYLKKNKQVASETLMLTNVGANSTQTVQAGGNKKGHTANVYIVGITSSRLHFCYPVHNGNPDDPFYCK